MSLCIQIQGPYEKLPGSEARRFCSCAHTVASPPIILGRVSCSKHVRGLLGAS